ncbi:hypothetical protein LWI28_026826 [Acer negundo]|uniref:Uncharacterized protein n=1 Tax=Acer negundo TaxID=4023 RepID=A0AAD5IRI7_ACENE|nr:hypothetical protein LWI28_026826 [Acer negundo]
MPYAFNMRECDALEEVKFNVFSLLVSQEISEWKTKYVDDMKWNAGGFAYVKYLFISIEFFPGKFLLSRDGLNQEVKLEEIYKGCKFTDSSRLDLFDRTSVRSDCRDNGRRNSSERRTAEVGGVWRSCSGWS